MARLGGIQRASEDYYSHGLIDHEKHLKVKLEEVLSQEEIIWLQKSSQDWLCLGDRNTIHFHQKTVSRRRCNNIAAIHDDLGVWIYKKEKIKDHAIQYFSSLYSCEHRDFWPHPHLNCFPVIDEVLFFTLRNPVEDGEIKTTVFGMHPLRAPGPDGFHAIFYHTQ